jgi:uncharacterized metal-binding protein
MSVRTIGKEERNMADERSNVCGGEGKLVFSCSGAADVGEIADRAARMLSRDGATKMYCLAGVGGHLPGIVKTTKKASSILAIDGCPLNCARRCLEEAGVSGFKHIQFADMGFAKGKSPATDDAVAKAAEAGRKQLN